jgi:ubiquinone/menaquinone biosynthesis C-methylase UbiE
LSAADHTPDAFRATFVAIASARAIITATQMGLIGALARKPASAQSLAAERGLDPAGVEALLGALASTGYLEVDAAGVFRPAPAAAQLIPGAAGSIAHFVGAYSANAWDMLSQLDELLRGELGATSHARPPEDPFWESYIRGLFELSSELHDEYARAVPARDPRTLLDLAGGHAGFAMAMCRRFGGLEATVLDLPASARVGRAIVAEHGLQERVRFREGDALVDELGTGFDVVSMFNLLHHLSPAQAAELLRRAHAALHAGGCVVIGETERAASGEPPSMIGAVSALVYYASSGTRNYTRAELEQWLAQAGFHELELHRSERTPWRLLYMAKA